MDNSRNPNQTPRHNQSNSDWLGGNVPRFAGNVEKSTTGKKLLFPRNHQTAPNPTERDKIIERTHLDLDLDTLREMLFRGDQLGFDAYGTANGTVDHNLLEKNSVTRRMAIDNGANLKQLDQIAMHSDFLPPNDEKSAETYDFRGYENYMLAQVFRLNMIASANFLKTAKFSSEAKKQQMTREYNTLARNARNWSGDLKDKLVDASNGTHYGGGFYDQDGSFFHITSPYGRGVKNGIECRLYLSPQTTNLCNMVGSFIEEHYETNHPAYYLKYINGPRNDRLVIYTDFDHVDQELEILRRVQQKHPELFKNMGKNPLWGSLDGAPKGVYFGEEPKAYGSSYGSERGDAFDDAFEKWLSAYGLDSKIKDPNSHWAHHKTNFRSLNQISDGMVYDFLRFFKKELPNLDIDPNNPCVNKTSR